MSDRELKRWASDQLHELLGFSQGYLADYVLSLARKERTVAGLVKALGEADVPGGAWRLCRPCSASSTYTRFSRPARVGNVIW